MCGRHRHKYLLASPSKKIFEKGLSGKYIYVCTCPNVQTNFLNASHFYKENGTKNRNMQTMQQNLKAKGFQIIKSIINYKCLIKLLSAHKGS